MILCEKNSCRQFLRDWPFYAKLWVLVEIVEINFSLLSTRFFEYSILGQVSIPSVQSQA